MKSMPNVSRSIAIRFAKQAFASFAAAVLLLWPATGFAAKQDVTLTVSANPSPVQEGETLVITGKAVVEGTTTPVSCGSIKIQYQYVDDVAGVVGAYLDLATGSVDVNGEFSANLDVTGLASQHVKLRLFYLATGGCDFENISGENEAPQLNVDIVEGGACESGAAPLLIGITEASGDGTPAPGDSGTWSYLITLRACADLTNVSAQGGSNGWSTSFAYDASAGTVNVSKKNKNEVATWLVGSMNTGDTETLEVTVSGAIKNSPGECGKTKSLNGAWSALYSVDGGLTIEKSAYTLPTETVTIVVTCP